MIGTIRFELRLEKKLKSGRVPISIIYSVKGQRKRFSSSQNIYPFNWDNKKQRAIYVAKKDLKAKFPNLSSNEVLTELEINEINSELQRIILQIERIERGFIKDGKPFSSELVQKELKANTPEVVKAAESSRLIFRFIEQYLNDKAATRSKASLSVYRQLKVHLEAFEKHRKCRITFVEIDAKFFENFMDFLIQYRDIANTTAQKQLRTLKTILGYAKRDKIEINESYKDYKIKRDKLDVFALTKEEFDLLYELDLTDNSRLAKVRDVFCFACATGLRYSDFSRLDKQHIKDNEIVFTHIKTRDHHRIPLNKYSKSILDKYFGNDKPLPIISQANMNLYLKELGKKAGINQPYEQVRHKGSNRMVTVKPRYEFIASHVGRKTFITNSLMLGMNSEEVMAISNHSDYRSFQRYVDITNSRKRHVMEKAWGAPEHKETIDE